MPGGTASTLMTSSSPFLPSLALAPTQQSWAEFALFSIKRAARPTAWNSTELAKFCMVAPIDPTRRNINKQ